MAEKHLMDAYDGVWWNITFFAHVVQQLWTI